MAENGKLLCKGNQVSSGLCEYVCSGGPGLGGANFVGGGGSLCIQTGSMSPWHQHKVSRVHISQFPRQTDPIHQQG